MDVSFGWFVIADADFFVLRNLNSGLADAKAVRGDIIAPVTVQRAKIGEMEQVA